MLPAPASPVVWLVVGGVLCLAATAAAVAAAAAAAAALSGAMAAATAKIQCSPFRVPPAVVVVVVAIDELRG